MSADWIFALLLISTYAQFNPHRTTHLYVPPKFIGGNIQSSGCHVKMHETYHAPQSIGGGFQSRGGFARVRDEPYVGPIAQKIINIAEFMAHN